MGALFIRTVFFVTDLGLTIVVVFVVETTGFDFQVAVPRRLLLLDVVVFTVLTTDRFREGAIDGVEL